MKKPVIPKLNLNLLQSSGEGPISPNNGSALRREGASSRGDEQESTDMRNGMIYIYIDPRRRGIVFFVTIFHMKIRKRSSVDSSMRPLSGVFIVLFLSYDNIFLLAQARLILYQT